ncbi:RidA family protein [Nocardia yamanashiensis]|uniref:RidA family protein n=1 Tax=Nocardia yamanashiensis TaxID=209247 RepID=UPI001E41B768|nr:RidA family protein [Nocardia yamanashiensis]UGT41952.1 RidA family protein [Nocardia yamanashiensis]
MPPVRARLAELGLTLPPVSPPRGVYVPAVHSGTLVHVAGQVPMVAGNVVTTGRVGAEITPAEAAELSRRCALAALAAVDALADLDRLARVVRVAGYVASAPGFGAQFDVVAAAVDLFSAVLGSPGRSVCTAVGVPDLPLSAPVEIEVTVELAE